MGSPTTRAFGVLPLVLFGMFVAFAVLYQDYHFHRAHYPHHDYNTVMAGPHTVIRYLANGHLPLWSPELNSGAPIWPDVEVFPSYDPISLLVSGAYYAAGKTIADAHRMTLFLWHCVFCLGVYVLFRRIGLGQTGAVFGFVICLFGPLCVLNFRQPDDYVTVYRYVPFLLYAALRFLDAPNWRGAVLLGTIGGLATSGYETANLVVLLLALVICAAPYWKRLRRSHCLGLALSAAIAICLNLPLLVAGIYWVSHDASAREMFPYGYRGGLSDLLGPLSKYYNNETVFYVGLVPTCLAVWRAAQVLYGSMTQSEESRIKYFPETYLVLVASLLWLFYIGGAELLVGTDQSFFFIRSFNNVLPYLMLIAVYFASVGFERALEGLEKIRWQRRPVLWVVLSVAVLVTLYLELRRMSLVTVSFHRYLPPWLDAGARMMPVDIAGYLNVFWVLCAVATMGLILGLWKKERRLVVMACVSLVLLDLSRVNTILFKSGEFGKPNQKQSGQWAQVGPTPQLPFVEAPPLHRERDFPFQRYGHYMKQGPVLFQHYAALAHPSVTFFRHRNFSNFVSQVTDPQRFDVITGVTSPIVSLVNSALVVTSEDLFRTINTLAPEQLRTTLVTDAKLSESAGHSPTQETNVEITGFSPNQLSVTVSGQGGYLVYRDLLAKGWRATVNGIEAPLISAYGVFKSLFVEAGTHEVSFNYRPISYLAAFWVRAASFFLCVGVLLLVAVDRRRSTR